MNGQHREDETARLALFDETLVAEKMIAGEGYEIVDLAPVQTDVLARTVNPAQV